MRPRFWLLAALVVVVPFTPRLIAWLRPVPPDPRVLADSEVDDAQTCSNILPGDYVGPKACASCHQTNYERWQSHPHARMNQMASDKTVVADFDNHVLDLGRGKVFFRRRGKDHVVEVERHGKPLRRYRVTRTVGTRYMQFYIGVQEFGPEKPDHALYREHMIPFAWWITIARWLPKPFFDPDGPEQLEDGIPLVEGIDHIKDVRPYNQMCMNCHNTYAYAYRVFDPMFVGYPEATVAVTLGPLARALEPELKLEPTVDSFKSLFLKLDPEKHLVSLGISCESCHLGGRQHAEEAGKLHWVPTSRYVQVKAHKEDRPVLDSRKSAAAINGLCTQCHSGNAHYFPTGAAASNSREGLDFHKGSCTTQMHCAHCHEPHTAGKISGGPTDPAHVAVCVKCHTQYREPSAALAHGGHPAAAGVNCLDCHMPRQTLGLDALIRTHRVGMPVEPVMAAEGSANACNLCHLDRSLNWTLGELKKGWGRELTPTRKWRSHEVLDRPMGEVWLNSTFPALRVMATLSYARSPLGKSQTGALLDALNDPESINRVFAQRAVEQVLGRKLPRTEYEMTAPPAVRGKQIEALKRGR
jgi:hypothetical protein